MARVPITKRESMTPEGQKVWEQNLELGQRPGLVLAHESAVTDHVGCQDRR